jgi:hypothetical protein
MLKYCFHDIDKQEIEHFNQGVCRASNHTKLWMKDAFDEWRLFRGFNQKIIIIVSKSEHTIKDLVEMLSIHINMNHMAENQRLNFHVFWSNFIFILQVFDLFTFQCSSTYYEKIWYDLE